MSLYNAEGIIIRVRDFDEADKIITVLTQEEGKVQAVARGARRPRNRYAGATQLFTQVAGAFFKGRTLDTVSQLDMQESFRPLREELDRMACATYACELTDEMITDKFRHESIYLLLLVTLHLLTADPDPLMLLRAFTLKFLAEVGFRPQVQGCLVCGEEVQGDFVRFSPEMGGVLCDTCRGEGEVLHIYGGTLVVMRHLLQVDLRKLKPLKLDSRIVTELGRVLDLYVAKRLEKPLKSETFLYSVFQGQLPPAP